MQRKFKSTLLIVIFTAFSYAVPAWGRDEKGAALNRLKDEKSPYLLQHAGNPVNWYPWGDEAFQTAEREDKPIFLSIGYSTCHWCHVMEHESFEDDEVAGLMNDVFISIKVDREERPDLDQIYMTVCQLLTGSGGWPLTIIMTPQKKPFFAGTYIPKESRYGRIGMLELIPRVKVLWEEKRGDLVESANSIVGTLESIARNLSPGDTPDRSVLESAYKELAGSFDSRHGGFGTAPKFPTPHNFTFLLRYWRRTGDKQALNMVETGLLALRAGGIYDHTGFGFHRYSTDAEWLVPHFEKMLYDQALLAMAYTEAYQALRKPIYMSTAKEIFTYLARDMTSPEGGFYSAEDADSEGEEGKFYLWSFEELQNLLNQEEMNLLTKWYGVRRDGNYLDSATGKKTGENILHVAGSFPGPEFEGVRRKLFNYRKKRVHPFKDDKILTSWNGLMIAALARAAAVFNEPDYAAAAEKAALFLLSRMRLENKQLLHQFRDGEAMVGAYSEDYAFLIWALIELYEATFKVRYLEEALELNSDFIDHFWDDEHGGFYMTEDNAQDVLVRQKPISDSALPSANSVAMLNLLRLGRMTGNVEHEKMAERISRLVSDQVEKYPLSFTFMLSALDFSIGPAFEIVIAGPSGSDNILEMIEALRSIFLPNKVVLYRPAGEDEPAILNFAEWVRYQNSLNGRATAYVCQDYKCRLPTNDIDTMLELLEIDP